MYEYTCVYLSMCVHESIHQWIELHYLCMDESNYMYPCVYSWQRHPSIVVHVYQCIYARVNLIVSIKVFIHGLHCISKVYVHVVSMSAGGFMHNIRIAYRLPTKSMSDIVYTQDLHCTSRVYVHVVSMCARVIMYNIHIAYWSHTTRMSYTVYTQDLHGTSKVYVHVVSMSAGSLQSCVES